MPELESSSSSLGPQRSDLTDMQTTFLGRTLAEAKRGWTLTYSIACGRRSEIGFTTPHLTEEISTKRVPGCIIPENCFAKESSSPVGMAAISMSHPAAQRSMVDALMPSLLAAAFAFWSLRLQIARSQCPLRSLLRPMPILPVPTTATLNSFPESSKALFSPSTPSKLLRIFHHSSSPRNRGRRSIPMASGQPVWRVSL